MRTVLIDYDSGNLHSAAKAFELMAKELDDGGEVVISTSPDEVARADRLVLPGDGAFPACWAALGARAGMLQALHEVVFERARPFMGVCVGMQLMATRGFEIKETPGLDWIAGDVCALDGNDLALKVPHMGWNDLWINHAHPVLGDVSNGDHVYFVHSYVMKVEDDAHCLAVADYGQAVSAVVGRDNLVGVQFHPEKSQRTGLGIIKNFLRWSP